MLSLILISQTVITDSPEQNIVLPPAESTSIQPVRRSDRRRKRPHHQTGARNSVQHLEENQIDATVTAEPPTLVHPIRERPVRNISRPRRYIQDNEQQVLAHASVPSVRRRQTTRPYGRPSRERHVQPTILQSDESDGQMNQELSGQSSDNQPITENEDSNSSLREIREAQEEIERAFEEAFNLPIYPVRNSTPLPLEEHENEPRNAINETEQSPVEVAVSNLCGICLMLPVNRAFQCGHPLCSQCVLGLKANRRRDAFDELLPIICHVCRTSYEFDIPLFL